MSVSLHDLFIRTPATGIRVPPTSRMTSSQGLQLKDICKDPISKYIPRFQGLLRDTVQPTAGEDEGCTVGKQEAASVAGAEPVGSGGQWCLCRIRSPKSENELTFQSRPRRSSVRAKEASACSTAEKKRKDGSGFTPSPSPDHLPGPWPAWQPARIRQTLELGARRTREKTPFGSSS